MYRRDIADPQDIIDRNVVKSGEFYQDIGGDIPLPQFVIAVHLLRAVQDLCHTLLGQVVILAQVPYSPEHDLFSPPFEIFYQTAVCGIDIHRKLRYNI